MTGYKEAVMHPDMLQVVAEERRKDALRAASRFPRPDDREPGSIRRAAAGPFMRLALALLGSDGIEIRERWEGRREAPC